MQTSKFDIDRLKVIFTSWCVKVGKPCVMMSNWHPLLFWTMAESIKAHINTELQKRFASIWEDRCILEIMAESVKACSNTELEKCFASISEDRCILEISVDNYNFNTRKPTKAVVKTYQFIFLYLLDKK
jgi:hypothetical protein